MRTKMKNIALVIGILLIGVFLARVLSNQKEGLQHHEPKTQKKQIKTTEIQTKKMTTHFESSGRLLAFNKIELFAEVSGVLELSSLNFKEGNSFKKGQSLLKIDDTVYKNNLLAQKSALLNQITLLLPDLKLDFPGAFNKWQTFLDNLKLDKDMSPLPQPGSAQERYYIAARNIYNLYYNIKSMEATLQKYNLRAPFDGMVTMANINPGTLVRMGQKLGEFSNFSLFEMAATVSVSDAEQLKIGMPVQLKSADVATPFSGKISRINHSIDPSSQTLKVYIHSSDARLKDGMYLTAYFRVDGQEGLSQISRKALMDGNRVFIVQDKTVHAKQVEVVEDDNDFVYVRGLNDGQRIVSEPTSDMRDGMFLIDQNTNRREGKE